MKKKIDTKSEKSWMVLRLFGPAIKWATTTLADSGLPTKIEGYYRLKENKTWTPISKITAIRLGEKAVGLEGIAEELFGLDSDQFYAVRVLRQYKSLRLNLQRGDFDFALFLAARLGDLLAERDMAPEALIGNKILSSSRKRGRKDNLQRIIEDEVVSRGSKISCKDLWQSLHDRANKGDPTIKKVNNAESYIQWLSAKNLQRKTSEGSLRNRLTRAKLYTRTRILEAV